MNALRLGALFALLLGAAIGLSHPAWAGTGLGNLTQDLRLDFRTLREKHPLAKAVAMEVCVCTFVERLDHQTCTTRLELPAFLVNAFSPVITQEGPLGVVTTSDGSEFRARVVYDSRQPQFGCTYLPEKQ